MLLCVELAIEGSVALGYCMVEPPAVEFWVDDMPCVYLALVGLIAAYCIVPFFCIIC